MPGRQKEVALLIQQSPIKNQLLAALDNWALNAAASKNPERSIRLLEVARLADPDPWRDRVRDPAAWKNGPRMIKLAEEIQSDRKLVTQLSPQMLFLVYNRLPEGKPEETWLRMAQALHPSDFWLNFELGVILARTKERVLEATGFYRAALAIRPNSGATYNNLGNAGSGANDQLAAIDAYNKALAIDPKHSAAWNNLGIADQRQKNLPAAIDAFGKAAGDQSQEHRQPGTTSPPPCTSRRTCQQPSMPSSKPWPAIPKTSRPGITLAMPSPTITTFTRLLTLSIKPWPAILNTSRPGITLAMPSTPGRTFSRLSALTESD